MQEKINQLEQQVAELMRWKKERELQQIKNPLDVSSERVIHKHLPVFQKYASSTITERGRLHVVIDGVEYQINCKPTNTAIA